jgi:hypothetical protein
VDFQQLADWLTTLEMSRQESKRTVYCEPGKEHALRAAADQRGLADLLTIKPSPACPEGKLLLVDENAIAATEAEWLQQLRRQPLFPPFRR